jgi:DNA-binding NarL/FixJ family response regulator
MRVVVAEDSVLLREGLCHLLGATGATVEAAVDDAEALLAVVGQHRPDLVIADVRMPPTFRDEGLRAAITIKDRWPEVAVLILSQYVEERYAAKLLANHTEGVGYLLKDRIAEVGDFLDAMKRVSAGGTALDPEVVAQILARGQRDPLRRLTPREREVLALVAEGRSNAGIAERLFITENAVAKHVNSIFGKLGLAQDSNDHRRVLATLRFLRG